VDPAFRGFSWTALAISIAGDQLIAAQEFGGVLRFTAPKSAQESPEGVGESAGDSSTAAEIRYRFIIGGNSDGTPRFSLERLVRAVDWEESRALAESRGGRLLSAAEARALPLVAYEYRTLTGGDFNQTTIFAAGFVAVRGANGPDWLRLAGGSSFAAEYAAYPAWGHRAFGANFTQPTGLLENYRPTWLLWTDHDV
jgi:hypothetical protein